MVDDDFATTGPEGAPEVPGTQMVAHDGEGHVVAILELRPGRRLRPLRVLEPFAGRH